VLGLAGLLAWIPYGRVVRDRDAPAPEPGAAAASSLRDVFSRLARQPAFWLLAFGAGAGSFCGYGLAFWIPALLQRSFDLTLVQAGQFMGAQMLLTGVAGVYAGGWLGDRIGHGDKAGYARVAAVSYALSAVLLVAALTSRDIALLFALLLIPGGLIYVWIGPVTTAVQHLVPPSDRATASACFLLINNGIGLGFGSLAVGRLSDAFTPVYGPDALRYALMAVSMLYFVATGLMLLAAPRLRRAWLG